MDGLSISELSFGDVVEIKCRFARFRDGQPDFVERWVSGRILAVDEGWPIALLDDDQVSEIRPFMCWRLVKKATGGGDALAA